MSHRTVLTQRLESFAARYNGLLHESLFREQPDIDVSRRLATVRQIYHRIAMEIQLDELIEKSERAHREIKS